MCLQSGRAGRPSKEYTCEPSFWQWFARLVWALLQTHTFRITWVERCLWTKGGIICHCYWSKRRVARNWARCHCLSSCKHKVCCEHCCSNFRAFSWWSWHYSIIAFGDCKFKSPICDHWKVQLLSAQQGIQVNWFIVSTLLQQSCHFLCSYLSNLISLLWLPCTSWSVLLLIAGWCSWAILLPISVSFSLVLCPVFGGCILEDLTFCWMHANS